MLSPSEPAAVAATRPSVSLPLEGRLRLIDYRSSRTPNGQFRAEVELEHPDTKTRLIGRAQGASSATGDLRVAADACLRALEQAVEGLRFDLVGVKSLRAFDATIIIVAVVPRSLGGTAHLLGCYLAGEDVNRGSAIAVLNATNRIMCTGGVRH